MASILQVKGKWRAQVRRKGHPPYTQTFAVKAQAEAWARQVEAAIDAGRPPPQALVMGGLTVGEAVREYRRLRATGRPVADDSNDHYTLRRIERLLGARDAVALTVDDLVGFCRVRAEEGAGPYTINGDVGKLGTVLRLVFGVRHIHAPDIVAQARPALAHLGLVGGGGRRERRPDDHELGLLLAWLARERGQVYADFVQFAVLTAMRRAEVARIVWADVDMQRRMVLVRDRKHPRQKKGNDDWVPLLGEAWDLVLRQPTREGPIFTAHPQTVSKYFRQACQALGIVDLQLRDMRHEGVSRLFEHGYAIPEVALVSGHRKWETLRRYTNLRPEDLHEGPRSRALPPGKPPRR